MTVPKGGGVSFYKVTFFWSRETHMQLIFFVGMFVKTMISVAYSHLIEHLRQYTFIYAELKNPVYVAYSINYY